MFAAPVLDNGSVIRWSEIPGRAPTRVYIHGLGASSAPYFAAAAAHPMLAGHRSLLMDMLGFGISDQPEDFDYTLESHADALAAALVHADVAGAEVVGHSMGGAVAIVLAHRHPQLVSKLVLVDANLDPVTGPPAPGNSGIASHTEAEFVAGGWREIRDSVGPEWWSTMRMAGLVGLYRSALHLKAATVPTMREMLVDLDLPRTFLVPGNDGPPVRGEQLTESGVELVTVPDSGHCIMIDNPQGFAEAVAHALR